jgi:hypothetical protein
MNIKLKDNPGNSLGNMGLVGKDNLYESESIQNQQNIPDIDTSNEEIVIKNKSKQFKFDCGVLMGRIDMNIQNKFGLKYHFENTTDFNGFLNSVKSFISTSGNNLTDNDISNLEKHYNKFK